MTVNSILSNFFSNLKNHSITKKPVLKQIKTNQILKIVKLLTNEGFIQGYELNDGNNTISILLKYNNGKSVINQIKIISKPSKRQYVSNKWSFETKERGLFILSTPKGILTKTQAQQLNVGGELICRIT